MLKVRVISKNMIKHILCNILVILCFTSYSICQNPGIKNFKKDSSVYIISPININSQNSDFSPFFIENKIIFASGRDYQYGVVYTNENKEELMDLYESEKIDSITFKPPKLFSAAINTPYNDGPVTINKNNNFLVVSSNPKKKADKKGKTNQNNLQLFTSKHNSEGWSEPALIKFCKSKHTYCHPSLSKDQKTLFFSSDMPGGYGGMDLYYSFYKNNNWSNPVNLGPKINSSTNEVFPYISADNILFFSCRDSTLGFGGLDIYSFDLNEKDNSVKKILEKPLNSKYDDFGIYVEPNGFKGYLSSNRKKENKDDIYFFGIKYPYFNSCIPFENKSLCFTFYEESTTSEDDNADFVYEWSLGDGTKVKGLEAYHCFEKPGNYVIELNVIDKTSDSIMYNEVTYDFNVENPSQILINCPDTIKVNEPITISSYNSSIPGFKILKYYWDFDDGYFSTGKAGSYTYHKKGLYKIHLAVLSKNDTTGIISNFCVEKQVVVSDFTSKYIEVTENTINKLPTNYTDNHENTNDNTLLSEDKNNLEKKNIIKDLFGKKTDYEEIYRIIVFDQDKYLVNQKYFTTLDSLSKILKKSNSMFKLVIYSDKDTIGKDKNYKELSIKRATSLKRYIIKQGVESSLIKVNPLGEKNPFIDNNQNILFDLRNRVAVFLIKKN